MDPSLKASVEISFFRRDAPCQEGKVTSTSPPIVFLLVPSLACPLSWLPKGFDPLCVNS